MRSSDFTLGSFSIPELRVVVLRKFGHDSRVRGRFGIQRRAKGVDTRPRDRELSLDPGQQAFADLLPDLRGGRGRTRRRGGGSRTFFKRNLTQGARGRVRRHGDNCVSTLVARVVAGDVFPKTIRVKLEEPEAPIQKVRGSERLAKAGEADLELRVKDGIIQGARRGVSKHGKEPVGVFRKNVRAEAWAVLSQTVRVEAKKLVRLGALGSLSRGRSRDGQVRRGLRGDRLGRERFVTELV